MCEIVDPEDIILGQFPEADTIEQRRLVVSKFLADRCIHRPLKVLIATNCISCGGEEHQAMRLIPELCMLGFEVEHLYYSAPHTLGDKYKEKGIESTFIDKNKLGKFRFLKKLTNHIRINKFDMVHAFGGTTNVYVRAAAVFAGTKIILASSRNRTGPQGASSVTINSLLNLFTSAWIINSRTNAEGLKKLKFLKNKRLYILPNALDIYDKSLQPEEMDFDLKRWTGDRRIVAAAGRLCGVKNYDFFIDSAKRIHEMNPESCFLIIGGPDCREEGIIYEKRLSKRIIDENLNSFVKMTGRMNKLENFYSHIDVLVSTSRFEGCPNVVLEAMRAAKPVVMTNSCDTRLIIREGENGYVVGVDDLDGMVQKIQNLLSSGQMRKQFGHKSREIVEKNFLSMNAAWILAKIYLIELKSQRG